MRETERNILEDSENSTLKQLNKQAELWDEKIPQALDVCSQEQLVSKVLTTACSGSRDAYCWTRIIKNLTKVM